MIYYSLYMPRRCPVLVSFPYCMQYLGAIEESVAFFMLYHYTYITPAAPITWKLYYYTAVLTVLHRCSCFGVRLLCWVVELIYGNHGGCPAGWFLVWFAC